VKARRVGGAAEEQRSYWIATIQYAYATPSKSPKLRHWNPLGFRVIDFRPEPEVLSERETAGVVAGGSTP
jgi:type IV secretory pathway component VirB8